ncbi:hypothetical protein BT63DRAFT_367740 [Microthyrium microscopicum]|uniref:PLC-like phosphodiesterase n=1 Tax=Microthyrium microscopicum TaxID=703497 RepID=A0A6A6UQ21_9PEZI|nr:hypothetical protein BT63DRAFT_367740 [Microthyrium microscopicum]
MLALIFLFCQIWLSIAQESLWSSPDACNNCPALCNRSYGNITHLGAHDSMFVANTSNSFTVSGNQFYGTDTQLDAGVRLLSGQLHTTNATGIELRLCHTDCDLYDGGSMIKWLKDVSYWMDEHPNDVVTLLLVNSVNANSTLLGASFRASGITKHAYVPATKLGAKTVWPTLGEMIQAKTRLVTFISSLPDNTGAPYLLDEFSYVFENQFEVTSPNNFSCMPDRPTNLKDKVSQAQSSGRLFLMNHFLDKKQLLNIVIPDRDNAANTNSPDPDLTGSLGKELNTCGAVYGRSPNFVLVDWFNMGPAISAIDAANGIIDPDGRTSVSTENPSKATPITYDGSAGRPRENKGVQIAMLIAVLCLVLS